MLEIEQFIIQAEKEIEKRRQILAEQRVERDKLALRIKEARKNPHSSLTKQKTRKKQSTLAPKRKSTSSKKKSTSSKKKSTSSIKKSPSSKTKSVPKKQSAAPKKKVVPRKKKTTRKKVAK